MRKDLKLCSDSDTKFLIRSLKPVWSFIFPFLAPEQGLFFFLFIFLEVIHSSKELLCFCLPGNSAPIQGQSQVSV